jgi:hypothetical protein
MFECIMAKSFFFGLLALVTFASVEAQNVPVCTELFISEYVEGSRNNKALEIYNPTTDTVDLSKYRVTRWQNGSASWTSQYSDALSGKLAPKDVVVLVLDRRDTTQIGQDTPVVLRLRLKADLFLSKDYNTSFSMSFNGDDAMSLDKYNITTSKYDLVDIFGKIGERPTPGWSDKSPYTGTGLWYSVDKTLIRKPQVFTGLDTILKGVYVAVNPKLYFNPTLEWNVNPRDMFDSLGMHNCNCNLSNTKYIENNANVRIFPNPATNQLFINTSLQLAAVEIVNSNGQIVSADWSITNNNQIQLISVNLTNLTEGIYTINLKSVTGQSISRRFIK